MSGQNGMRSMWASRAGNFVLVGLASPMLIALALGARSILAVGERPPCRMAPSVIRISLSREDFVWLEGEEQTGSCERVPIGKWIRKPSGPSNLFVYADGPSGSGRFWNVTIGMSEIDLAKPSRGICLMANTVGWRTLQQFKVSPLPWLDDVDGDGKAEVILWASFPLRSEASTGEFGLTAWVYRLTSENTLVIDWDLTRKQAREIAAAYRTPLKNSSETIVPIRAEAATALEMFADERCTATARVSRQPTD